MFVALAHLTSEVFLYLIRSALQDGTFLQLRLFTVANLQGEQSLPTLHLLLDAHSTYS